MFDSQFTAENSTFWAENEKKTKLKNAFSAENETGRNHHKSSFLATKTKFGRSLVITFLKHGVEENHTGRNLAGLYSNCYSCVNA